MSSTEKRTDIRMNDVFISWTGYDRELKDKIVGYLRSNGITVLESDRDCTGDFMQWSREAASKGTVFLLLYTENTINSKGVAEEISALKQIDDWKNRCLPVVSDSRLYTEERLPDLAKYVSAISMNGREPSDAVLAEILKKVQKLISNRFFKIYSDAAQPAYLKIKSLLKMTGVADREFNYETLYISRTVIDEDKNAIDDPTEFMHSQDILFLQGPAGSGKSCYIDQLRNAAGEDVLVMALPCRKLTGVSDLREAMFAEFCRYCGNRTFYTMDDFKSLLSVKRLFLVLDGMDEIATKNATRELIDTVSSYYCENASSTTLFFTSRNDDDADIISMNGQKAKRFTLQPLNDEQIKTFGKNLFLLLEKPDKSDEFYVHIMDLAHEIRTNPLLLSQLAMIYDKKDAIPQTDVGIYDAVCEITFSQEDSVVDVPQYYRDMITQNLPSILKAFSAERYRLASDDKQIETVKVFSKVMKDIYPDYPDSKERAEFLDKYLRDRAVIIDGEFYHKMLLEYFTAVYYYEKCFVAYDKIKSEAEVKELFAHYTDPYWSAVLKLFLVKADSLIDSKITSQLYGCLAGCGITEYTLLLDTCRDLICHKEEAQCALLGDILRKSASGEYPPYGPLFWYVPEYELYEQLLLTLDGMRGEACFVRALALVRDVCWIFGYYNTVSEITDRVSGEELFASATLKGARRGLCELFASATLKGVRRGLRELFASATLKGVRRGLCELFYTGKTDETGGDDVYPRCFNLAEARSWKERGQGVLGRMQTAFADEFSLYSHDMPSELGGEYIGIVAAPYDLKRIEAELPKKPCRKLRGLFLSPTEDTDFKWPRINSKHLKRVYVPENAGMGSEGLKEIFGICVKYSVISFWGDGFLYFLDAVSLPAGEARIEWGMFFFYGPLKTITIPNSVRKIGWNAFCSCSSLESITLPDSVTVIGRGVFNGCASLQRIYNCPSGYTKEYLGVTDGCIIEIRPVEEDEDVFRVSDSVIVLTEDYIPQELRTVLREVILPDSVTEIREDAFAWCSSLAKITIPDSVREIGREAFWGCSSLEEIKLPDGVTEIGDRAFEGCTSLKSITIPYSVTKIGWHAFKGCSSLESITIPDSVTKIGDRAFEGCSSLKSITLPASVTKIGYEAFKDCSSLKSITIPDSVTQIGRRTFEGCSSLKSITLPASVTKIGDEAFKDCSSLKSITIPNSVTEIGECAFKGCSSLKSIKLPDSVTEIGDEAFKDCSSLESIAIPDSVTEIGYSTFRDCSSLKSIKIPDSVTKIGEDAFWECTSLKRIGNCPAGHTAKDLGVPDDCIIETRPPKEGEDVLRVPDGVAVLARDHIPNPKVLKKVIFSDSVTEIGWRAFDGCSSLAEITIPDGVTEIGGRAFEGCSSLAEITIPDSVTKIGGAAFSGCSSLEKITIPDSVTYIEWEDFFGCSSLKSITIPSSVIYIGMSAFEGCVSLKSITIPSSVTHIEMSAFKGCSSLKSITIPASVKGINYYAFEGCTGLKEITIPASVKGIGDNAFEGCTGLKEIKISHLFEDDLERIGVDLSKVTVRYI